MDILQPKMHLHWGVNETILFEGWRPTSVAGFIASAVVVFALALLNELVHLRARSAERWIAEHWPSVVVARETNFDDTDVFVAPGLSMHVDVVSATSTTTSASSSDWRNRLVRTLFRVLHVALSFVLMLIVMTFNAALLLTVLLGTCVGFVLLAEDASTSSAASPKAASSGVGNPTDMPAACH
jgi:copper transporter 1